MLLRKTDVVKPEITTDVGNKSFQVNKIVTINVMFRQGSDHNIGKDVIIIFRAYKSAIPL